MTNRFCAHSSVILVFISRVANKHQNNPLVSTEKIRHSSTYIILYIFQIDPVAQWENLCNIGDICRIFFFRTSTYISW